MRRLIVGALLALLASAGDVQAQQFDFFGCDGDRSCHAMSIRLSEPDEPGSPFRRAFVSVISDFKESGGFYTASCGTGWWFEGFEAEMHRRWGCDINHGGPQGQCVYEYSSGLGFWCEGVQPWAVELRSSDVDFGAQDVIFNLTTRAIPGDPRQVRIARVVPEPTAALMLAAGALGLGLVARRRRPS